jgi:hypothetical protein
MTTRRITAPPESRDRAANDRTENGCIVVRAAVLDIGEAAAKEVLAILSEPSADEIQ